jgi:hypothetical protein
MKRGGYINLTPKRLAWLIKLRDHGPCRRDGTTTGFFCMRAGWTEWNYRPNATAMLLISGAALLIVMWLGRQ